MPSPTQLLKIRVKAFRSTLHNASESSKKNHVTTMLAEEFNRLVTDAGATFPDIKTALPSLIQHNPQFRMMGISGATYLDLEIMAEQVLGLLDAMEPN